MPNSSATLSPASAAAPTVPPARPNGRLPELARPVRYAISLEVDPRRERFTGTQQIELTIARPTRVLVLHARGLDLQPARVRSAAGEAVSTSIALRSAAGGRGTPEELVLTFDREIPAGAATLEMSFEGEYDPALRGIYRVQRGGEWYAFTQFEPNDARRAFPCFDEPGFKVPWSLSLRVPRAMVAAANMPEASRTEEGETALVQFAPTPPTSSYLLAFAVGPFDVVEGARTPVPIRALATRGQGRLASAILEAADAQVRLLGEYFDRPFPYPKLDLVAVPEFSAGAMENPGLITFREELMLFDPAHVPTAQRRSMASVLAHELAHHWFGDLVTMTWWNDLWLNEGFATWMEARVVDQWQPAFRAQLDALHGRGQAMDLDALPAARAVRQPVSSTSDALEAFDWITYRKGAAVLSMLEQWTGEAVFRDGVRQYVQAHAWGNATAADLFAALDRAAGRDVSGVAATFLDQPGVPLVEAQLACPAGGAPTLTVSQSRYRVAQAGAAETPQGEAAWRIPVCVQFEAVGGPRQTCVELSGPSRTVPLEGATRCPRWLHPNAGETGYYRYALTPAVRALLSPAMVRTLDVRARAGLVENAWALVRGGQLGADEFLRVLEAFRGERERVVLESVYNALYALFDGVADAQSRPALQTWIAGFFRPLARELGWEPRPGEDDERRLLRRLVLSALGAVAEDRATLAEADRRAQAYLRDPRTVDADLALLALPLSSRRGDAARLEALLQALGRDPSPADRTTLQTALASFEDPVLLRRALESMLTDAVRVQDRTRAIYAAASHPARRAIVWSWVQEHFERLQTQLPGDLAGRLAGLSRGACSAEEIAQMEGFWRPRVEQFEGAGRALREGIERAGQCIALREREHARLRAHFAPAAPRRGR